MLPGLFVNLGPAQAGSVFSAGFGHVRGIQSNLTLICWGNNDHNQAPPSAGRFH